MKTLLIKLEDNHKILESLEIESPTTGKSGAANSSDHKSAKQEVTNPVIQQPTCPVCGSNHDTSQCMKELARLNAEATKQGAKLPGAVPRFCFKNPSFVGVEPPEGLENVPEIMTISPLEISDLTATHAGPAGPQNGTKFSRE